jgi:WD40 repeat protein
VRRCPDAVWCMAWAPDRRRLATGSRDRTVRIWDTDSGAELAVLAGHDGEIRGLAWSPDGQQLVTGSMIGRFGSGTPNLAWRSSASASTRPKSEPCPGVQTAGESPLPAGRHLPDMGCDDYR